jgi:hypothetical protein
MAMTSPHNCPVSQLMQAPLIPAAVHREKKIAPADLFAFIALLYYLSLKYLPNIAIP